MDTQGTQGNSMETPQKVKRHVCMQCVSDALEDSDFCADCEDREFRKIRGWLYVPAIGLVLSLLAHLLSINTTLRLLIDNYSRISGNVKGILLFELLAFIGMFLFGLYVAGLFFRKKRELPRNYILLILAALVFVVLDLILGHRYLDVPVNYEAVKPVVRNLASCAIWIPYFLVSLRVKRTFVK